MIDHEEGRVDGRTDAGVRVELKGRNGQERAREKKVSAIRITIRNAHQ